MPPKATNKPFKVDWIDWDQNGTPSNLLPLDYNASIITHPSKAAVMHRKGLLKAGSIPSNYDSEWKKQENKIHIFLVPIDSNADPITVSGTLIAAPCPPFCDDLEID